MKDAVQRILKLGILPVIHVKDPAWADPLAQALIDGGIPAIEVLARSEGALEVVRRMKQSHPEMIVGAGTILRVDDARAAVKAGADFIVSPGYDQAMVDACIAWGVPIVPGCSTATEVQRAYVSGLRLVKFFPTEAAGGRKAMEDLAGPFAGMKFLPTGGISLENLENYLSSDKIGACGGSFVAPKDCLERGDFSAVTEKCRRARRAALGFRLAHVGINHGSREEAAKTANLFCTLFGLEPVEHARCTFAGTAVECNDFQGPGEKGHIGFRTWSMPRALAWLEEQGVEWMEDYRKYDADGALSCVYFKDEIAGFAVHITK